MPTRDEYVALIKDTFSTVGIRAATSFIAANFPFTQLPVIRHITQFFIRMVIKGMVDAGEMAAFFMYVDFRVSDQKSEFEKAAIEYRRIKQIGTKEEIANAEEILFSKFVAFARLSV
jgi:hypothetical protein